METMCIFFVISFWFEIIISVLSIQFKRRCNTHHLANIKLVSVPVRQCRLRPCPMTIMNRPINNLILTTLRRIVFNQSCMLLILCLLNYWLCNIKSLICIFIHHFLVFFNLFLLFICFVYLVIEWNFEILIIFNLDY